MDLRLTASEPSAAERAIVDLVLGPPDSAWVGAARGADGHSARGGHAARSQRHLLLPVLHELQGSVGWISAPALGYVCRRLTIPPAEAYGVASFYALFALEPRAPRVVHVCTDIACMCRGGAELVAELERTVGPAGQASPDGTAIWLESPCLGLCEQAPAALLTVAGDDGSDHAFGGASGQSVAAALAGATPEQYEPGPVEPVGGELRLLRRIGHVDPTSAESYRNAGGYAALRRALELGQAGVIREVTEAKLMGRGGAAFPTGRKWDAVARNPVQPHYLVCNADESEPGTFKDRIVIENDPFALIEALTIAGYAIGCEHAYIYVRGEYPLAWQRLTNAIEQARTHDLLGDDVLGTGLRFHIELRKGAGAYICGEETALFNSIEGFRGEPRNKPPFPVDVGLFGKPTVVNNVESLINVLDIVLGGGEAFARIGTEQSTGTRLLCLSGCVERPGLYEAPFGITLREVIDKAGGVAGGRELKAVLLGGAAGGFVGPDKLDVELSFEGTRAAGATLGSGVVMLFDDRVDLVPVLLRIAAFFRDESCGQCVPCRVGTVRQQEALLRLASGPAAGQRRGRAGADRRDRPGDARRVDLRPRPDGRERGRVGDPGARGVRSAGGRMSAVPVTLRKIVELEIDGEKTRVFEGSTILDACRSRDLEIPTLCYGESLTPVNACRVCMVELEGSRVLVPSCARKAEDGMVVRTASERVRHSRKMVLEFLGSSVDLSTTPDVGRWSAEYGARPERYGPPAPPAAAGVRDSARAGHHHAGDGQTAATVAQPVKVDNENYVRDYAKCILCYKCVEACGTDWQNTFAIAVAGRGFDARIATEFAVPLPESACVYCGNCIAVCPTGALMFKSEHDMRADGSWDAAAQTVTETICSYCGVGCSLELHVQDNEIVKVTSPLDHSVTHGNLCVKGRFGYQYVQNRAPEHDG